MNAKKNLKQNTSGEGLTEKLNIIEKIVKMITNYGYRKVISALLVFILFVFTIIVFSNQKVIVEKILTEHKKEAQMENANNLQFRVKYVTPRVDAILYKLLAETKADRAWVIEMHNGTDNPTGLPFAFGDMTYEKMSNDTIPSVLVDYDRISLSAYPISTYVIKNKKFVGTTDELRKIDKRMAMRVETNNIHYMAIYCITGMDVEIGWVGLSYYAGEPVNPKAVESYILDASQKLSILLDMSNNVKKE
jgi:hypothetical protein